MLTVDQIRREMEAEGFLPQKEGGKGSVKMGGLIGGKKEARALPEVISSRWIYLARSAELIEALRKRFGVAEDLSAISTKELRAMLRKKIGGRIRGKRGPRTVPKQEKTARKGLDEGKAGQTQPEPDPTIITRLVRARTLSCPACGAQLMIERG